MREPGPPTPGPGAHQLAVQNVDAFSGRQVLSTKVSAPRPFLMPETYLEEKHAGTMEGALGDEAARLRYPGPGDYATGATREVRDSPPP